MDIEIPFTSWEAITVDQVLLLFTHAPFAWGLAGGHAIEQFLGKAIREHADIDIVVFRDEQLLLQRWLAGWRLYAADPPGCLRPWEENEYLPFGIHDIWGHQLGAQAWQLQIMLNEVEGSEWFSRHDPHVRGLRSDLFVPYQSIPCVRVEVQLLYKARHILPKDEQDFQACLPLLSTEAKQWLRDSIRILYPDGNPWLKFLAEG